MNIGNISMCGNGLQVSIDWLSWTFTSSCLPEKAVDIMGYSMNDFYKMPRGMNGYKSQIKHSVYNISVQYEGNADMGVHIDISGSAVSDVLLHYQKKRTVCTPFGVSGYEMESFDSTVVIDLLSEIQDNGHVTRLDLAIDDLGANYFTLPILSDLFTSGSYCSKFRKWTEYKSHQNGNECLGHTIYLGSRKSDIMIRIYDKQLEQNGHLLKQGNPPILEPWVRWELELKGDRARQAVLFLINGFSVSKLSVGILSQYIRIIQFDNARKDRCSNSAVWDRFIGDVERLALYKPSDPKTLEDKEDWLLRQVSRSFATVVHAKSGDISIAYDMLKLGTLRLNSHDRDLIRDSSGDLL